MAMLNNQMVRPIFEVYVRGYPHKRWLYVIQYLHFRILIFPWILKLKPFFLFPREFAERDFSCFPAGKHPPWRNLQLGAGMQMWKTM